MEDQGALAAALTLSGLKVPRKAHDWARRWHPPQTPRSGDTPPSCRWLVRGAASEDLLSLGEADLGQPAGRKPSLHTETRGNTAQTLREKPLMARNTVQKEQQQDVYDSKSDYLLGFFRPNRTFAWMNFSLTGMESAWLGLLMNTCGFLSSLEPLNPQEQNNKNYSEITDGQCAETIKIMKHLGSASSAVSSSSQMELAKVLPRDWKRFMTEGSHTFTSRVNDRTFKGRKIKHRLTSPYSPLVNYLGSIFFLFFLKKRGYSWMSVKKTMP